MKTEELMRAIAYGAAIVAGLVALVFGIIRSDWQMIALGATLVGVDVLAVANLPSVSAKKGRHAA